MTDHIFNPDTGKEYEPGPWGTNNRPVDGINLAQTEVRKGVIYEKNPPTAPYPGDVTWPGMPSNHASIAIGDIRRTSIYYSNMNRTSVCDFVGEVQEKIALNKIFRQAAEAIRDGIRWIIKALAIGDPHGKFTEIAATIRYYAREIESFRRKYIVPIIEFEKYILAYITKLRAFIQYILSLPKRFLEMMRKCLNEFLSMLKNLFTDFLKQALAVGGAEADGVDQVIAGFNDVVSASKELGTNIGNTIKSASEAVALAAAIPVAATAGLVVPVSEADVEAANNFIAQYEIEHPTIASLAGGNLNTLLDANYITSNTKTTSTFPTIYQP